MSMLSAVPSPVARVLAHPPGERRNAGLNELAFRYHAQLETFIRNELEAVRFDKYLDAQDLVQSLYLKLLTVAPQEHIVDERHLMNWLRQVLRNHMLECAKALKTQKRDVSRVQVLPDDAMDLRANPQKVTERNEELHRYAELLNQVQAFLDNDDWELLRRHHLDGVAQSTLAAERGRTPGAVCQRLRRIYKRLAGRFSRYADVFAD